MVVKVKDVPTLDLNGEHDSRVLTGDILYRIATGAKYPKDAANVALNVYLIVTQNLGVSDEDALKMVSDSLNVRRSYEESTATPQ